MVGFNLKIHQLEVFGIAKALNGLISGNYEVIQLILDLGLHYQALRVEHIAILISKVFRCFR